MRRELGPGEKVSLHEARLVARSLAQPSSHALTRLVAEGLLTVKSRRGYYVTALTKAAIEEGYDVGSRSSCRRPRARSRLPAPGLRRLRELHEATADAVSHEEWDVANAAFHEHQVDLAATRSSRASTASSRST